MRLIYAGITIATALGATATVGTGRDALQKGRIGIDEVFVPGADTVKFEIHPYSPARLVEGDVYDIEYDGTYTNGSRVLLGTWKIMRGTGAYSGLRGGGRYVGIVPPTGRTVVHQEGWGHPLNRTARAKGQSTRHRSARSALVGAAHSKRRQHPWLRSRWVLGVRW